MKKFKLDIYTSIEKSSYNTTKEYYGSFIFETEKDTEWVFNFLQLGGGQLINEGTEIEVYHLRNYTLIQITDFFREGSFYKNLIYGTEELVVTNIPFLDNEILSENETVYFLIEGDNLDDVEIDKITSLLQNDKHNSIKLTYSYEWGLSAFWENYIIGVLSSVSVTILDKLTSFGISKDKIKSFKLSADIKKKLAKEYNMNPDSLFLESYNKDEDGKIHITYRNISFKVHLQLKKGEVINLKTESLTRYIK